MKQELKLPTERAEKVALDLIKEKAQGGGREV